MGTLQPKHMWHIQIDRIAPSTSVDNKSNVKHISNTNVNYYLFDYFDRLFWAKDTWLPESILGPYNQSDINITTEQNLTFINLDKDDCNFDIFSSDPAHPFLSVILVSIIPSNCSNEESFSVELPSADNIDAFMHNCASELKTSVSSYLKQIDYSHQDELSTSPLQVFHCTKVGNLCLALRTTDPSVSYLVASHIRSIHLNAQNSYGFPSIRCSAFTVIGIENTQKAYETLKRIAPTIDAQVALRLSFSGAIPMTKLHKGLEELNLKTYGLLGRYDILIHLEMNQFVELYPFFHAYKFNTAIPQCSPSDPVSKLIYTIMKDHQFSCINERILANINNAPSFSSNLTNDNKNTSIDIYDKSIREQIELLKTEGTEILQSRTKDYTYMLTLLEELWQRYASLSCNSDSLINSNILITQVFILIKMIRTFLSSLSIGENAENDCEDLITHMRRALDSIDHFHKYMQSVNQQSLQSPNYEIQMHGDPEKYLIAYTEFCRSFLSDHFRKLAHSQLVWPVFNVNLLEDSISATPLFLLPYRLNLYEAYTNPNEEWVLLSITIRDIPMLGNLYRTLPLLCHEMSHNFRVIERKERNDTLLKYVFSRVANYCIRSWISSLCQNHLYASLFRLEDSLLVQPFQECLSDFYYRIYHTSHNNANIGVLITNILTFLTTTVFPDADTSSIYTSQLSFSQIEENIDKIINYALDPSSYWIDTDAEKLHTTWHQIIHKLESEKIAAWFYDDNPNTNTGIEQLHTTLCGAVQDENVLLTANTLLLILEHIENCPYEQPYQKPIDIEATICDSLILILDKLSITVTFYTFNDIWSRLIVTTKCVIENHSDATPLEHAFTPISDPLQCPCFMTQVELEEWTLKTIFPVVSTIDKLRKSPINHSCVQSLNNLKYILEDVLRRIIDVNLLFRTFSNNSVNTRNAFWQMIQSTMHKLFVDSYQKKIRDNLEYIYKGKLKHFIEATEVRRILSPLCLDMDDGVLFIESFETGPVHLPRKTLKSLIRDSVTLYREVFADLGMCAALNLTAVGYLNVMISNLLSDSVNDTTTPITDIMTTCRICLVCHTLNNNSDTFNWTLPVSESDHIKKLQFHIEHIKHADVPFDNLAEHFLKLYNQELKSELHPTSSHAHNILSKIGRFYNNAGDINNPSEDAQKTQHRDLLSFVMQHYYRNWALYCTRPNFDFIDEKNMTTWLRSLMGGTKN